MTKSELSQAVNKALSNENLGEVPNVVDGYGLPDFKPVHITLNNLAALVRWQCVQLNGSLDSTALNELAQIGKKKFLIL